MTMQTVRLLVLSGVGVGVLIAMCAMGEGPQPFLGLLTALSAASLAACLREPR